MNNKVFFPHYSRAGYAETLTEYFIGDKKYKVFLLTIDDENKIVHDEQEKGPLTVVTIEAAHQTKNRIEEQIRKVKRELYALTREKEKYQHISHVLQEDSANSTPSSDMQPNDNKKQHTCNGNCNSHQGKQKKAKKEEGYILETPIGFVAKIDEVGVEFTPERDEAKIFKDEKEAVLFGINVFRNQLPFMVNPFDSYEEENQSLNPMEILSHVLGNSFSGEIPSFIKEILSNGQVRAFKIDHDGNVQEL